MMLILGRVAVPPIRRRTIQRPECHALADYPELIEESMHATSFWSFLLSVFQTSLTIFLLIGASLGVVAGLVLLLDRERAFRISAWMNRWVSTRAALRPLEAEHSIKRPLYRRHRLFGILICAGAAYSIMVLGSARGAASVSRTLLLFGPQRITDWIAESLTLFLLIGNAAALVFGVFFFVRPSLLKGLETWADRQISTRQTSRPLEIQRFPLDNLVRSHPRSAGVLILAGSTFVLASIGLPLVR
jgi:hypothetical protein